MYLSVVLGTYAAVSLSGSSNKGMMMSVTINRRLLGTTEGRTYQYAFGCALPPFVVDVPQQKVMSKNSVT